MAQFATFESTYGVNTPFELRKIHTKPQPVGEGKTFS